MKSFFSRQNTKLLQRKNKKILHQKGEVVGNKLLLQT